MLPRFKLEEYFAKYEFSTTYTMGSSDPESYTLTELVSIADEECLSLWNDLKLNYTHANGLPLLREEISQLYDKNDEDNVLIFSGAEEAIYITMRVIIKSNDHVVVLTPCYQSLKEIPKAMGANVTEFALDWENNSWSFDLEKFKAIVTNKTKLVILNFPHNPTGFHPSLDLFKDIIEIVKNNDAYLFCDEVYRLSEQDPKDCLPNAVDCYEKALSLGVMSKSFGLPGLRIGWLVSKDTNLLRNLASYKNYTSICNSAPSEILSVIALKNKESILQRNKNIAKHNLDLLDNFFSQYSFAYEWYRPRVGFINFPRLKLDIDIDIFTQRLIHEEGILLLPGTLFDNTTNHFRLGYGRSNLSEALTRLARFTNGFKQ